MEKIIFNEESLKSLITRLEDRGYDRKGISKRIGYDEKGQTIADALRGKNKGNIKDIITKIYTEFSNDVDNNHGMITLKTIDDKINKILKHLNID